VKPPVSGGAYGTFRVGRDDPIPDFARGRRMIVQPLVEAIATHGEYSLMLFGGVFSHAVLKKPATGDFRVQPHLGGTTEPCGIPDGAEALAKAALAAAPAATTYARVDMLRDDDGELRLMELELVEPALFLDHAPEQAKQMFADAVLAAAERVRTA
jgi:glutathione synthase/RimK-type ligase-like ATP-grasp enzyme